MPSLPTWTNRSIPALRSSSSTMCYGLADLETKRPITTDSSFYLASISKQFTAMAIMMLAEQGKLSFDDRLLAYFPRFPSWGTEITLRHMLHHTSGLPDYVSFFQPPNGEEMIVARDMLGITNEDVLERAIDLAGLEFPAGTKYAYTDTGYVLLAMIVAIVSGRSPESQGFRPARHEAYRRLRRPPVLRVTSGHMVIGRKRVSSSAGITRC
jgi:hypothetical protein